MSMKQPAKDAGQAHAAAYKEHKTVDDHAHGHGPHRHQGREPHAPSRAQAHLQTPAQTHPHSHTGSQAHSQPHLHSHAPRAGADAGTSMLMTGVLPRLLGALAVIAVLWAAVVWALMEQA